MMCQNWWLTRETWDKNESSSAHFLFQKLVKVAAAAASNFVCFHLPHERKTRANRLDLIFRGRKIPLGKILTIIWCHQAIDWIFNSPHIKLIQVSARRKSSWLKLLTQQPIACFRTFAEAFASLHLRNPLYEQQLGLIFGPYSLLFMNYGKQ